MKSHGFKTAHWPGWDFEALAAAAAERLETADVWVSLREVLAEFEVFCDVPYPFLYRQAFAAYPDAKFLLILRDVCEWTASVRRHIGDRIRSANTATKI
jgi:hypothetical protein